MATLTLASRQNLFDVQKLKAPNGGAVEVTNTLVERNDLIGDLPAVPANGGIFHQGARVNSLPSGTLTDIGGTWGSSKGDRTPFVEALATVRSRFQSPKDVLETEGQEVSQQLVSSEKDNHLEGLGQSWCNLILKGPVAPTQNAIVGLEGRAPYNAIDSEYTYDNGGSGNDLRSGWLIRPGVDKVHMLYNPNHPTLGVGMQEKGEVFVQDPTAASLDAAEGRWDIIIEFMLQQGICIRDQRCVKRIANVQCGPSDVPTADFINNVIRAANYHTIPGEMPWNLYCDAQLYTQLVIGANSQLMVYTSDQNIYRTKLMMIGDNVIVRRLDALNYAVGSGESVVS